MTDLKNPKWKYFFPCGQWLAKDEGDGQISRDLVGSRDPLAIRKGKHQLPLPHFHGYGTEITIYMVTVTRLLFPWLQ